MRPQQPGTLASVLTLAHRVAHCSGASTPGGSRGGGTRRDRQAGCRPGHAGPDRALLSWAAARGSHPTTRGPSTQSQNSLPPPLPQSRSRSPPVHLSLSFFFLQKEGRGGKKMLHCAARPVSERRGANQRWPFRKLPFMARAAAAAPYKTRRRDAQPQSRPRPLRHHRPLALAAPPSPPVYTATR